MSYPPAFQPIKMPAHYILNLPVEGEPFLHYESDSEPKLSDYQAAVDGRIEPLPRHSLIGLAARLADNYRWMTAMKLLRSAKRAYWNEEGRYECVLNVNLMWDALVDVGKVVKQPVWGNVAIKLTDAAFQKAGINPAVFRLRSDEDGEESYEADPPAAEPAAAAAGGGAAAPADHTEFVTLVVPAKKKGGKKKPAAGK